MRKIFYILITFFGISCLLGAFFTWRQSQNFVQTGRSVEGTVLEVRVDEEGSTVPTLFFRTPLDEDITFELQKSKQFFPFEKGEKVKIIYNPKNPHEATVDSYQSEDSSFFSFLLFGIIFVFLGTFRFFFFFFYQKKLSLLKKKGNSFSGKISFSERKHTRYVKKIFHSFFVEIQYPLSKHSIYIKSPLLWRPTGFLQEGQTLQVYIDPKHPNRYYIDIPFLKEMV